MSPVQTTIVRERLLSADEVADWVQMDRAWVVRHSMKNAAAPRLPCVKFGRELRYRREDVEQFIAEQFAQAQKVAPQGAQARRRTA